MPFGRYTVLADGGEPVGTEEFRCAPGPVGWRYFSTIETAQPSPHREVVDVAVDADWRPARIRIDTSEHDLLLEPRAGALAGFRDREPIELPWGPDAHVDYFTPATNLITTKRLASSTEIEVVYLDPFTLEDHLARQHYELLGDDEVETPVGTFLTTRWRFTWLDSGWTSELWVAGDVVVRYDRLFELTWYDPGATGPRVVDRPSET